MATTVADLTPAELRAIIEEVVHDQILELMGDPDEGLQLRADVRAQLERQQERVRQGDLGSPLAAMSEPPED